VRKRAREQREKKKKTKKATSKSQIGPNTMVRRVVPPPSVTTPLRSSRDRISTNSSPSSTTTPNAAAGSTRARKASITPTIIVTGGSEELLSSSSKDVQQMSPVNESSRSTVEINTNSNNHGPSDSGAFQPTHSNATSSNSNHNQTGYTNGHSNEDYYDHSAARKYDVGSDPVLMGDVNRAEFKTKQKYATSSSKSHAAGSQSQLDHEFINDYVYSEVVTSKKKRKSSANKYATIGAASSVTSIKSPTLSTENSPYSSNAPQILHNSAQKGKARRASVSNIVEVHRYNSSSNVSKRPTGSTSALKSSNVSENSINHNNQMRKSSTASHYVYIANSGSGEMVYSHNIEDHELNKFHMHLHSHGDRLEQKVLSLLTILGNNGASHTTPNQTSADNQVLISKARKELAEFAESLSRAIKNNSPISHSLPKHTSVSSPNSMDSSPMKTTPKNAKSQPHITIAVPPNQSVPSSSSKVPLTTITPLPLATPTSLITSNLTNPYEARDALRSAFSSSISVVSSTLVPSPSTSKNSLQPPVLSSTSVRHVFLQIPSYLRSKVLKMSIGIEHIFWTLEMPPGSGKLDILDWLLSKGLTWGDSGDPVSSVNSVIYCPHSLSFFCIKDPRIRQALANYKDNQEKQLTIRLLSKHNKSILPTSQTPTTSRPTTPVSKHGRRSIFGSTTSSQPQETDVLFPNLPSKDYWHLVLLRAVLTADEETLKMLLDSGRVAPSKLAFTLAQKHGLTKMSSHLTAAKNTSSSNGGGGGGGIQGWIRRLVWRDSRLETERLTAKKSIVLSHSDLPVPETAAVHDDRETKADSDMLVSLEARASQLSVANAGESNKDLQGNVAVKEEIVEKKEVETDFDGLMNRQSPHADEKPKESIVEEKETDFDGLMNLKSPGWDKPKSELVVEKEADFDGLMNVNDAKLETGVSVTSQLPSSQPPSKHGSRILEGTAAMFVDSAKKSSITKSEPVVTIKDKVDAKPGTQVSVDDNYIKTHAADCRIQFKVKTIIPS
jgi:hypothetical protein